MHTSPLRRLSLLGLCALASLPLLLVQAVHAAEAEFTEKPADKALLQQLRKGGYVLYMRHGTTDNSRADRAPEVDLNDCATQRVLNDEGRKLAADVGAALERFFGVPYEPFRQDRIKPLDLLKNLKRDYVQQSQWLPLEDTPEGMVILTIDPEQAVASRVVQNVFPKASPVYRVTTDHEFVQTLDQFFGAAEDPSVTELLSDMADDDGESTSTASSWFEPISPGLAMGPPAWSVRSLARPSQNWARFRLELSTVGALMGPCCHLSPMDVGMLSVPPMDRLWHELQEMNPDLDNRGSKYSFLPSSTMPRLTCVAGLTG